MTKQIMYRLIADEGMILTNGTVSGKVIDIAPGEDDSVWEEISDGSGSVEQQEIIDILTGNATE